MSTPRITLKGNIGQQPELRFTQAGKAVTTLSIAANPAKKNRQTGEWEKDGLTQWYRVTLWEKDAENAVEQLHKGDEVTVTGGLIFREFTRQDGSLGISYEIEYADLGRTLRAPAQTSQQAGGNPWGQPAPQQTPASRQAPQPAGFDIDPNPPF